MTSDPKSSKRRASGPKKAKQASPSELGYDDAFAHWLKPPEEHWSSTTAGADKPDLSHFGRAFASAVEMDEAEQTLRQTTNPAKRYKLRRSIQGLKAQLKALAAKDGTLTKAIVAYQAQSGEIENLTAFIEWAIEAKLVPIRDPNTYRIHLRKHFSARGERGRKSQKF